MFTQSAFGRGGLSSGWDGRQTLSQHVRDAQVLAKHGRPGDFLRTPTGWMINPIASDGEDAEAATSGSKMRQQMMRIDAGIRAGGEDDAMQMSPGGEAASMVAAEEPKLTATDFMRGRTAVIKQVQDIVNDLAGRDGCCKSGLIRSLEQAWDANKTMDDIKVLDLDDTIVKYKKLAKDTKDLIVKGSGWTIGAFPARRTEAIDAGENLNALRPEIESFIAAIREGKMECVKRKRSDGAKQNYELKKIAAALLKSSILNLWCVKLFPSA